MRIGVLALQGDVREHSRALRECGAEAVPVRRRSELDGVDGLVIPGGESTVIDRLLRTFELHAPLQDRIGEGMPVYGSCAGLILLADRIEGGKDDQQTLGGLDITARRNAFGRQVDSFEADLWVEQACAPGEEPMRAVFIRAPWVEAYGPEVEVLASVEVPSAGDGSSSGRHPVAVRQGNLLATSFHPEVTGDTRVHRLFTQMVRPGL